MQGPHQLNKIWGLLSVEVGDNNLVIGDELVEFGDRSDFFFSHLKPLIYKSRAKIQTIYSVRSYNVIITINRIHIHIIVVFVEFRSEPKQNLMANFKKQPFLLSARLEFNLSIKNIGLFFFPQVLPMSFEHVLLGKLKNALNRLKIKRTSKFLSNI